MKLKELIADIDFEILFGETDVQITGISCDSRKCKQGYVFVAIRGFESDGHKYIKNAVENGAIAIFYEAGTGIDISNIRNVTFIKVLNTRKIYSLLCCKFYGFPAKNINLIGVTGTNGKTTISYIIEKVLPETAVMGTINYRYGKEAIIAANTTPMSCDINNFIKEVIDKGAKNIVLEVSSHGVELNRVDYIDFDIGIFTNLTPEHLDFHKNINDYFNAKKRFFTEVLFQSRKKKKIAIVNIDDEFGEKLIKEIPEEIDRLTYSLTNKDSDIFAKNYSLSLSGSEVQMKFKDRLIFIKTNLIGEHNIYNILASFAAAITLNSKFEISNEYNLNLVIPGRLERPVADKNIFVDYAHTPDALEKVLINLKKLKGKKGKIITVFGCGGDRDKSKRPVMGYSASKLSNFLVITSDNPRTEEPLAIIDNILEGVNKAINEGIISNKDYRVIPDRKDAITMCLKMAKKEDIVLIAGKGHEDYQIIGNTKTYFSDSEVVKNFYKSR